MHEFSLGEAGANPAPKRHGDDSSHTPINTRADPGPSAPRNPREYFCVLELPKVLTTHDLEFCIRIGHFRAYSQVADKFDNLHYVKLVACGALLRQSGAMGVTRIAVDESNARQLSAWDGDQGDFWVARAERFDEGVARYRDQFFAAAAIGETANVLDIGCGTGQTTRDAARFATHGSALGVDLSARMVEFAGELARKEDVANAAFLQADAQVHPFPDQSFDVVISRHGTIFFGDPLAAFTKIGRATRSGGRLVMLSWQPPQRNEWTSAFRAAFELPAGGPGALSDPDQVRELLSSAGFADVRLRGLTEPMYFGRDVEDASQFISEQFAGALRDLDTDTKARRLDALRASMADHQTAQGVFYGSAAWLIEARRH
jgi:SAM-dependent methyltransferase